MTPIFNASKKYPRIHVWWFQLKSVRSYHVDKYSPRMDRQRDAGNNVQGVKTIKMCPNDWPHLQDPQTVLQQTSVQVRAGRRQGSS